MKKILVGTDTSASADLAVERARLARSSDAELLVLQVRANEATLDAADPKKSADPDRYLARMGERFPGLKHPELVRARRPGRPDRRGRRGRARRDDRARQPRDHGWWWRVRDSVPNVVLRRAPCSVLIVDTRAAQ